MKDNDTKLLSEAYVNMYSSKTVVTESKALTPKQIASKAQAAGTSSKDVTPLPKNKEEDKATEKTLEKPPYTNQNPENFNQDGVDTKVKERYVVKEAVSIDRQWITKRIKDFNSKRITFSELLDGIAVDLNIKKDPRILKELETHLEASMDESEKLNTNADEIMSLVFDIKAPIPEKVPVNEDFTRTDEQQAKFDEELYSFAMGITSDLQLFEQKIRNIGGEFVTPALIREASQTLTRIVDDFRRGRNPFGASNPQETDEEPTEQLTPGQLQAEIYRRNAEEADARDLAYHGRPNNR